MLITPLSPDDDQQQEVTLSDQREKQGQPYGVTAVMIALLLLLLLRGFAAWPAILVVNLAIVGGALAYFVLLAAHPRLPAFILCLAGAELGMLYSLPVGLVYVLAWHNLAGFTVLVWCLVFAGIIGTALANWLDVDARPLDVILTAFLTMFVFIGLLFTFLVKPM